MKLFFPVFVITLAFFLAGCGRSDAPEPAAVSPVEEVAVENAPASDWESMVARTDDQGEVEVEVIPLNLDHPGETIDFQVSLNTHSVDLNMNLAELAVLSVDGGRGVVGLSWDGMLGGHHVGGTLKFPANENGAPLLDGASRVTLTIVNVDAAERVFTWDR